MKRVSRGYSGLDFSLFPTMISAPETSPSRITSSPSLSPQHTPVSTSQPPNTQPIPDAEETVKLTQARRSFRIVVSDDEEGLEDPSKQGRKITEIDQDPSISLVQDEGTSWIQEDIEIQEKISDDTEVVLEEEPTELVEDQDKGKAIMEEDESVQKKTKKKLEQEILGHEEAIRLQEQIDEEERQRIARDAEIAKQLQEEINKAT
ncbi:hypothetical protein Tco_1580564 [Tanacetum coccineum]